MIYDILIWFIVGIINGFKDRSALNRFKKPYWNKGDSWENKWKLDKDLDLVVNKNKLWYYLGFYAPRYKERFPYSSTFFVAFTDGWHLLQFLQFKIAILGYALRLSTDDSPIVLRFITISLGFSIGFLLSYELPEEVLRRKNLKQ